MSTEDKIIRVGLARNSLSTLPGNSGELSIESSDNDTTIYGNVFSSSLPGVLDHSFSGNAWMRETAGFEAKIKKSGTPTAFTTEAMSLVSGKTYRIVDFAKSLWDYTEALTVFDNAVAVSAANIASIDYMFGAVTFAAGYTVTGPVTVTGTYMPTAAFGCANSVSLTQNAEAVLDSCFETIQANDGFNSYRAGLKTVSAELSGFYKTTNDFVELLKARESFVLEIDWEGNGQTMCRGVFRVGSTGLSGDVGANEEFSASFVLSTPEGVTPFSWYFGATTQMTAGMQAIINAWVNRQDLFFDYFPFGFGSKGYEGQMVVTDASISVDSGSIAEMSVSGQGNGVLLEVLDSAS